MPILARILKDRGIITERQLQEAIQHQVLYGGRLGTNLYELGFITEEFGVRFEDDELVPDNFRTLGGIAARIADRRTQSAAVRS